jgi:hypothetical protein
VGFAGGRWVGNSFAYNRTVTNINVVNIHNTYNETVVNNVTVNRVSFNGGAGGVAAVPTAQERAFAREPHIAPTPLQRQHVQEAARNPALAARANGGHPAIAATQRPGAFSGPGVVGARGATAHPAGAPQAGARPNFNGQAGTRPNVNGAAPNAAHPQPGKPQPGKQQPPKQHPNPPKEEKHEP